MSISWWNHLLEVQSRPARRGRRGRRTAQHGLEALARHLALCVNAALVNSDLRQLGERGPGATKPADERLHQSATGPYVLATGESAAYRLRILHDLYGPGTRRVLLDAGLRPGMRVADLGCGVGMVTGWLAELVGPRGHVVGIDASGAQLAQARERLTVRVPNTSFVESSATATDLPPESFDLVYCRFLLLHLPEPELALREMRALLKPNGILVCEEGDLTSAGSEPPSVLGAFADLFGRLGPECGLDYTLGRRLFHLVKAAGFPAPEISFNQPVLARGENKRLLELSVAEAAPALISAGLITAEELESTLVEMRRLAADESVLAVMPRMAQVWASKACCKYSEGATPGRSP
jgi:SAM-dependent methyltransferase